MLTRDIDLEAAILDLVDNSVHSLVEETGLDVSDFLLGDRRPRLRVNAGVEVSTKEDRFEVRDTCGGISVSDAQNHVFLFGAPSGAMSTTGLGVYGIGLKRAVFKLGKTIDVYSRRKGEEFQVHIDVDEWRNKTGWTFDFVKPDPRLRARLERDGTVIAVNRLREGVGQRFGLNPFRKELERRMSTTYALFLKAGLKIMVNGQQLEASLPEIAWSNGLTPSRRYFTIDDVAVLLVGGIAGRTDQGPRGGWYVFCNGRMVLEADRTELTGWGENFPSFHSKYNSFVGYVYFRSTNPQSLPWTTTKNSVVRDNVVYEKALQEMKVQGRPIINFLNKLYPSEVPEEGVAERALIEDAKPVPLDQIPKRDTVFTARPRKAKSDYVNIMYKVLKKDVDRVRASIGKPEMPAYKVGLFTFKYYLEKESS
jgi:hypothetical protein